VAKKGIAFPGFVGDLRELYHKTKIVCAPIFSGAGTRVKIIEAAAYGKPIIAPRIGAEGIDMRDGREILIRDEVDSFIEVCLLLLRDMSLCEQLGAAARPRAIQLYDRNNVRELIRRYLTNEAEDEENVSKSHIILGTQVCDSILGKTRQTHGRRFQEPFSSVVLLSSAFR